MDKRDIKRFFAELFLSARLIAFFEAALSTIIISIISLALARFFLIDWRYVLPAPAIYLLVRTIIILRIDALRMTEHAFPILREQLITIRDNIEKTHEMEIALENDVISKSKSVETSGFFRPRTVSVQLVIIIVLFFVGGVFSEFTYLDLPDVVDDVIPDDVSDPNFNFWQRSAITGSSGSADLESGEQIFGDDDPLLEGVEPIPIELENAKDALDIATSQEIDELETFDRYTPTRIDVEGARYYEETIPVRKHEIVRNYFRDR